MQQFTNNRITQRQHLASKAVDHSARPDPIIYAPVDGTIDSFMQRGSGRSDAGLMLRLRNDSTRAMHSWGHCERSYVKPGQRVKKGQPLAVMGHTGYTIPSGSAGAHAHYYIKLADGSYIYPPSIYSSRAPAQILALSTNKGEEMANATEVKRIFDVTLHRSPNKDALNYYTGKDANVILKEIQGSAEFKSHDKFTDTATKTIKDLQKALKNEQNKPAKVVTKEVEKIVEKIVNVEVPVEVIVEVEPSWLKTAVDFIRTLLRIK